MKRLLDYLPIDKRKREVISVGITVLISGLLALFGIYGFKEYGIALFILTPFFIGFSSTVLFGYNRVITKKDAKNVSYLTLGVFTFCLLLFAIEGIICVAMAAPIGILFTWVGSLIGYATISKRPSSGLASLIILIGMIPSVSFVETAKKPTLLSVVSSIEIEANIETVWNNVIEFPELDKPTEFIFKTGIAYPIDASINGSGVGAVRHCNFTTGSFVEPIVIWDAPHLLKFTVGDQPAPMKELSFWDIDAPHLHDYFVSKEGQFKLIALSKDKTLLEGTTWYFHNIYPGFYWQIWSDYIIHKIHIRVLNHIKTKSEAAEKSVI